MEVELKTRIEAELRPELETELKKNVECEIKSSLEAELKPELEVELKIRIEAELRPELETEIKTKLECEIQSSLETELKPRLELELKARLETELRPKLVAELKTKLEAELKPELEAHTQGSLKSAPETEINSKSKYAIEFDMDTKQIVEAILFAADKPMTTKQVQKIYPELEMPELQKIQAAIDSIIEDYEPRAIGLKKLASGYSFQVKEGYSYWVSRVFEDKPPRYSRALLETVAIIAYRQPVTRGDIEDIRGVSVSSNIIRTLLDREWVRVIAHKEVPGRPALYGTTKQFLDYFNLSTLDQLPTLEEIKDLDYSAENTVKSDAEQETEQNHSQDNTSSEIVNKVSVNQEQESEKQTSENPQIIEPISETRH